MEGGDGGPAGSVIIERGDDGIVLCEVSILGGDGGPAGNVTIEGADGDGGFEL